MSETMRLTRDVIAVESLSASSIGESFQRLFPELVSHMKAIAKAFDTSEPAIALTRNQNDFVRNSGSYAFLDVSPMTAFVPEGMQGAYLDYANDLDKAVKHVVEFANKILPSYCTFLSVLITNRNEKFSTNPTDRAYELLGENRKALLETLNSHFKNGSTETKSSYGVVVNRNNEWPQVFHILDQMRREIGLVNRNMLHRKIEECDQFLEVIIEKTKRGELEGMSGEVVRTLADGAFQIATELQFFSVVYYRVLALTGAVNATADHFQKIMKK